MRWFAAAVVILALILGWWLFWPSPPEPQQTTRVELEAYGGFAYIHPPGDPELNIAFLKSADVQEIDQSTTPPTTRTVCKVDQLGVRLKLISGELVPPLPPPHNRMWDLAGATVTFHNLDLIAKPLVLDRGDRPQSPPFGPAKPSDWDDVKWVPGMSYGGPQADYPLATLDPNWRGKVDGRVVLTRGEIRGAPPSDVAVKDSIFQFKTKSGAVAPFSQALSDTTYFTADIPGDVIVLNLAGALAPGTPAQITIRPTRPGRPVKLRLMGVHSHQTPVQLPVNSAIDHFCAFYQLLQQVPNSRDQLIPYLISGPPGPPGYGGVPSPGAYCPGDWYPE